MSSVVIFANLLLMSLLFIGTSPGLAAASTEPEGSAEIIAAQLHRHGIACTEPREPAHDTKRSAPHESVWILHCDEALYEVRLQPRTGARVRTLWRMGQRSADCRCTSAP